MDDEAEGSLAFALGDWGASKGCFDHICVGDAVVEPESTWATAVDFWELFQPFVFSERLFASLYVREVCNDRDPYFNFVKDVAWRASSWTVAISSSNMSACYFKFIRIAP